MMASQTLMKFRIQKDAKGMNWVKMRLKMIHRMMKIRKRAMQVTMMKMTATRTMMTKKKPTHEFDRETLHSKPGPRSKLMKL